MEFKLATYRRMNGMAQQSVAEALGISVSLYNGLETGKRRMNETYLAALADLYHVDPRQMIVDQIRDDSHYSELDEAYRQLSPAERKILVAAAKGIAAFRVRS